MSSWHPKSLRPGSAAFAVLGVVVAFGVSAGLVLALRGGGGGGKGVAAPGTIAYSSPDGIRLIDADGRDDRLIPGTEDLDGPEWRADGTRLAAVDLMHCCQAYAFAPDGSGRVQLPADTSTTPAWSPDGDRLAVVDEVEDGVVIRIRPLGGHSRDAELPLAGNDPAWSPDGKLIAFQGRANGEPLRIFLVQPDGSGLRPLLADTPEMSKWAEGAYQAAWAADGRRIAFSADYDGDSEIYLVRSDGTGLRKVTSNTVEDGSPTWSPDGRWLAFERAPRNSFMTTIVLVELATGAETEIATAGGSPAWRPTVD